MFGILDNLVGLAQFHQAAAIHDGNPIAQIAGRGKAVSNKELSDVQLVPHL